MADRQDSVVVLTLVSVVVGERTALAAATAVLRGKAVVVALVEAHLVASAVEVEDLLEADQDSEDEEVDSAMERAEIASAAQPASTASRKVIVLAIARCRKVIFS
ncbi:hypothetical protein ANCDUO_11114 [Ancylostoma duodenale]|uniref:Uncharacterized protein n=1 Tax=Ancylostoma duodenale TaxID=51022 RepID=A0A0C2GIF3_9BILA|nr:hypothetical protein ANCDUO_11114 [Ancylostoma duodenale]